MSGFAAGVAVVQGASAGRHGVDRVSDCGAEEGPRSRGGLLHITCEGTYLRKQQRRFLHSIFAAKHGEIVDTAEDLFEEAAEESLEPAAAESTVAPLRLPSCVHYTSRSLSVSVPQRVPWCGRSLPTKSLHLT